MKCAGKPVPRQFTGVSEMRACALDAAVNYIVFCWTKV